MSETSLKTSIFPNDETQFPKATHKSYPTWALVATLIIIFFIFKKFIYLKDGKRHNK
ncbi:MAG: hypothetical protein KBD63_02365 [Bacteriovoracaceae bacterium]|nr:hypothetical protein [Bacteriovoracaceae bacterium]